MIDTFLYKEKENTGLERESRDLLYIIRSLSQIIKYIYIYVHVYT